MINTNRVAALRIASVGASEPTAPKTGQFGGRTVERGSGGAPRIVGSQESITLLKNLFDRTPREGLSPIDMGRPLSTRELATSLAYLVKSGVLADLRIENFDPNMPLEDLVKALKQN